MAITKIIAISHHLNRAVDYAMNREKTGEEKDTLAVVVDYALNPEKTEKAYYQTALNCDADDPSVSMLRTKQRFGKLNKRQGYHIIQSFAEGEVTAEKAHEIGAEFAKRYLPDYEVVIGTHLNTDCFHNHIVFNSVSFKHGRKYHADSREYETQIRALSDALCREYEISVIERPKGKGRNYREYMDEKQGKPTYRSMIKTDVDASIAASWTFAEFIDSLKWKGYKITRAGPTIKHMSVRPPGANRNFRFDSLEPSELYTTEAIRRRIDRIADGYEKRPGPRDVDRRIFKVVHIPRKTIMRQRKVKMTHFQYLVWRYMIVLQKAYDRKLPARAEASFRADVLKFDKKVENYNFMLRHGIRTWTDLNAYRANAESLRNEAGQQLDELRPQLRKEVDEAVKGALRAKADELILVRRTLRKEISICDRILCDLCPSQKSGQFLISKFSRDKYQ